MSELGRISDLAVKLDKIFGFIFVTVLIGLFIWWVF